MKVLVTGANGQLAGAIVQTFQDAAEVRAYARTDLDITDFGAVMSRFAADRPDVVINCASYNNVDRAQEVPEQALTVNAFGVRVLARAAGEIAAALVHYSTDFVFDGTTDRPYLETDPCRPLSTYGMSKLLGEYFALERADAYVLRVESLFGGRPAKSSIDKIVAAVRGGEPVRVFAERTVTPSYVEDVAAATERLIERRPAAGVYHCVNSGVTTWLGIAEEIVRLLGREAEIVPVKVADVKLKAKRPLYCALSNDKLAAAGIPMPTWQQALGRYLT